MKQFKIKKATPSDAQAIYEINKECLPLYYQPFEINMMINSKDHLILIVKNNKQNKIAGYLLSQYQENRCHILSFGVSNQFRKQGFGTLLINSMKEYIGNRADMISLYVHVENENAIKFYKKNLFEINKTIENYYNGKIGNYTLQNAYFMIKIIK
ncbi:acetyltransferase GNAT family protein [Klosneuvirus KNV1]|uniref:Acetyltransferase GNAT family protein n=1 Tax=Klosneuvirus KNV1 TaxID=1977640 RepID=A0A1V0SLD0_9VIRU|nr:acetyltransferase GNAT family protein [Klosneuvirus KNV1]